MFLFNSICTGTSSGPHSQASSLAEDCIDAYVPVQSGVRPMAEEYIDMNAQNRDHALPNNTSSMSSAASSCSITSGTPSTDVSEIVFFYIKIYTSCMI